MLVSSREFEVFSLIWVNVSRKHEVLVEFVSKLPSSIEYQFKKLGENVIRTYLAVVLAQEEVICCLVLIEIGVQSRRRKIQTSQIATGCTS